MLIKICGITSPLDAEHAARYGANWIGIVFAHHSKRRVSIQEAQIIASTARNYGAYPVGVFAYESAKEIEEICEKTGIHIVQLHGTPSKQAIHDLPPYYQVIDVCRVHSDGMVESPSSTKASWLLFDYVEGGSGCSFNWNTFNPPLDMAWILAGGLSPSNVANAIALLKPNGVDVSSGVEIKGSTRKDLALMREFIQAVQSNKK